MSANASTWQRGSGLFAFTMEVSSEGRPAAIMERWLATLLEQIAIVGEIASVSFSTHSEEDARWWTKQSIGRAPTAEGLSRELSTIRCVCTLLCTNTDQSPIYIDRGMVAYIEYANREAPDPTKSLEITISVNTDIYAAVTWADDRDNRLLAALNAPSFNRFLKAVVERWHAYDLRADTDDYVGQVNAEGFVLPG